MIVSHLIKQQIIIIVFVLYVIVFSINFAFMYHTLIYYLCSYSCVRYLLTMLN